MVRGRESSPPARGGVLTWVRSREVTSSGGRKRDQRSGNSEGMSGSASPVRRRGRYSATWAWRMRSLASRAAAVAAAGQTRSMATHQ
ncbi:hypothetical protein SFUMM280S_02442 [Streptomyces fumanus]